MNVTTELTHYGIDTLSPDGRMCWQSTADGGIRLADDQLRPAPSHVRLALVGEHYDTAVRTINSMRGVLR
jgi:hypothetical protein